MPPLRERPGDLPLLVQHFLQRFTPPGRPLPTVSPARLGGAVASTASRATCASSSHAIEHAVVLSGGGEIDLEHLPAEHHRRRPAPALATGGDQRRATARSARCRWR